MQYIPKCPPPHVKSNHKDKMYVSHERDRERDREIYRVREMTHIHTHTHKQIDRDIKRVRERDTCSHVHTGERRERQTGEKKNRKGKKKLTNSV